jgi:putative DNA primase/helicase
LNSTFDDPELIAFLQRSLGYCLTGLTHQQCFWLLHGTGRNGKSTFLDTVKYVLGDYATTTRFESLTYTKTAAGSAATPDLARLRGRRMVTASEGQENSRMDEAQNDRTLTKK